MSDGISKLLRPYDAEECPGENLHVKKPGAVAQIEKVVSEPPEHFVHRVGVSVAQCGYGGYSGAALVQRLVARVLFYYPIDVEPSFRTMADEGHASLQHIHELRKLVKVMLAQETSCHGQARVVVALVECRAVQFRVGFRASEFEDVERFAVESDAFLPENGRASVLTFDGDVAYQVEGRAAENQKRRQSYVCRFV